MIDTKEIAFRGSIDSHRNGRIKGWCVGPNRHPAYVSIDINDELMISVQCKIKRKDLIDLNICAEGGGFDIDINSTLRSGPNVVTVKRPDGLPLWSGLIDTRTEPESITQEYVWTKSSLSKLRTTGKIGILGDRAFAENKRSGSVMSSIISTLGLTVTDGCDGDEDVTMWFGLPGADRPRRDGWYINKHFSSNQKSAVDEAHQQAMGRRLSVDDIDPVRFYIVKSEQNAVHDGKSVIGQEIIDGKHSGKLVQKIINNQVTPDSVCDIRVPIIGGTIPFVYLKYRPLAIRFSNTNTSAIFSTVNSVLSQQEQAEILEFCRVMKLDYGELDVLRDQDTNELWVVDVNNTPAGPPNGLSFQERRLAIRELSTAFSRVFLHRDVDLP